MGVKFGVEEGTVEEGTFSVLNLTPIGATISV